MTTVLIVMASLCVCLGIVVLLGKGDMLISGYNTASEEAPADDTCCTKDKNEQSECYSVPAKACK